MIDDTTSEPGKDAVSIRAALKRLVAEMKRANKKMERDKKEIEKLKAQTRAKLARLKVA